MPVSVPVVIADPPAAPAGYTLCAFEVRTYAKPGGMLVEMQPIATFAGTTEGFEDAANILVKAVEVSLKEVGVGLRLAAVAWWADQPLSECPDGRERLVSVYDAAAGEWGAWTPEERIDGTRMGAARHRNSICPGRRSSESDGSGNGGRH